LSPIMSQRTEQNPVTEVFFCISLNEKGSANSSMVEESMMGFVAPELRRYCSAHATRTKRPLAVSTGSSSN
jgi:hypothetical protein